MKTRDLLGCSCNPAALVFEKRLIEDARAMGHTSIRLETGRPLTEAISLYTSLGFAEVAPWDTVPPALDGILTAFQMEL